mgnify:CR=1 FL=1
METYQIYAQNSKGYFNIVEVTGILINDTLGTRITDGRENILAIVPQTMLVTLKQIEE